MSTWFHLSILGVGILVSFHEILAELDVERDAQLSTVNIYF